MKRMRAQIGTSDLIDIPVVLRGYVVRGEYQGRNAYALVGAPVGRERCVVEVDGQECEAFLLSDVEVMGLHSKAR